MSSDNSDNSDKLPPLGKYIRIKDNVQVIVKRHSDDGTVVYVTKRYFNQHHTWPVYTKNFWKYYKRI